MHFSDFQGSLNTVKFQSKTMLTSTSKQETKRIHFCREGPGTYLGVDVKAQAQPNVTPLISLSEVMKSGFDTFGRGRLALSLQVCESQVPQVHLRKWHV